jgi:hypothetical protein
LALARPKSIVSPAVWWLVALAFAVRVVARLFYTSNSAFWSEGYTFFFDIAQSIAAGQGIAMGGTAETFRVPLYPLVLAALTFGHQIMWPVMVAQSAFGAGTVLLAAMFAHDLSSGPARDRAAICAAAVTALYPYYVIHDTSLEETSLFTLLTLGAVVVLMKAAASEKRTLLPPISAGLLLGLDVLTRASIAPFAAVAPIWLLWKRGARDGILCAMTLAVVMSPWLLRNYILDGVPTLSAEAGELFWTGNNGFLFSHYPQGSSDLSKEEALKALSPEDQLQLERLSSDDMATDRWFWKKAFLYIGAHRWQTIEDAFRKNAAAFSWAPSPRHSRIQNLVYASSFGPVMLLGLWGMWRRHARWREDSLVYLVFATFILITAAFWAHTSHRSYLDVYWIVYGAAGSAEAFQSARSHLADTHA